MKKLTSGQIIAIIFGVIAVLVIALCLIALSIVIMPKTQFLFKIPTTSTSTYTPTPIPSKTNTVTPSPTSTRVPMPSITANPMKSTTVKRKVDLYKGPYLIYPGDPTKMEVVWQFEEKTTSILEWGVDSASYSGYVTTNEYDTSHMHRNIITGLQPGTRYYYRISVADTFSDGNFITAPSPDTADLNFFVYGDSRDGTAIQDQIAGQIVSTYETDPSAQTFVVSTGDLVDDGDIEWMWDSQLFDPMYTNIRTMMSNMPYLPVMGNHEGTGVFFSRFFPMPFVKSEYWSFNYGPAHFAMVNQYAPFEKGTDQYNWLKNDLETSTKTWKFIVMHMPAWSASENNLEVQLNIAPLAEQYGVSVVLAGHNHYYARAEVNGVYHITAGGGGAPLYNPANHAPNVVKTSKTHGYVKFSIQSNSLTGIAYDLDGNIVDQFSITK